MPRAAAKAPKKAAPKAHKLAEEFPPGTLLTDTYKKQWKLSSVIGQGGFGLIYLATSQDAAKQGDERTKEYVVKIEPKENGPLYSEMHFYMRVAKPNFIKEFVLAHKLRYLSIPPYICSGRHLFNAKEYRFLVMPRFGTDLQKYLVESGRHFSPKTTFAVGLRMLDALQFMHEHEYVHADIKAANILTGFSGGAEITKEVYLVDFGLAYRYTVDGNHKEYKEDPRRAHDGTIEFTSRDSHKGVAPSRRGDLEILGYCMLQWLCVKLPWEDKLSQPSYVAEKKERLAGQPRLLIQACVDSPPGLKAPTLDCIRKYMEKVNELKYDSTPDYNAFRDLLRSGAQKDGLKDEWKLDLVSASSTKGTKRVSSAGDSPAKAKKRKSSPVKSPAKKKPTAAPARAKAPKASKLSPAKKPTPKKPTPKKPTPKKTTSPKKPASKKAAAQPKGKYAGMTLPVPSPSVNGTTSRDQNGHAKGSPAVKKYPMPPATSSLAKQVPNGGKKVVRRRVAAVQSDMCIQTSPGLLKNV